MTTWPTLPTPLDASTDGTWGPTINQALNHLKENENLPSYVGYNVAATAGAEVGAKVFLKKITIATRSLIVSIDGYIAGNGANVPAFGGAVYSDSSGAPQTALAASAHVSSAFGTTARWFSCGIGVTLDPGDYWIAFATSAAAGSLYYDTGGSDVTYVPSGLWWHDQGQLPTLTTTANKYAIRGHLLTLGP